MMPDSDHSLTLRFFDLDVSVSSTDPRILEPFIRLYTAFRIEAGTPRSERPLRFQFIGGDDPLGGGHLMVNDEMWPVSAAMCRSGALYEFMLKCIYERVQSHLLIHASAVEYDGVGILFVADSGFGKSTLALSLSLQGAGFLSDEVGAVNRATGRIDAFPRCLRLEEESLVLAGMPNPRPEMASWFGKLLVDIESIRAGALIPSAPLGAVILLGESAEPANVPDGRGASCLEFLVDRFDSELVSFAEQLPGVSAVRCSRADGFATLRIEGEPLGPAAVEIEGYCRDHRLCVLNASTPIERPASFVRGPAISPVPAKHAIRSLVQQFLPGRSSWILRHEFQGQSSRLMLEMIRLFRSVKFYRMTVGEVPRMVEMIDQVIAVSKRERGFADAPPSVVNQ